MVVASTTFAKRHGYVIYTHDVGVKYLINIDLILYFIDVIADDQRLKTFLRGCKFSLEKVKKKLDMYYTMRNAVPEFFANRDVDRPELAEIFKVV